MAVIETKLMLTRVRLAERGLTFVLYREPDGWHWNVPERPINTRRRAFPTVAAAVEHAYGYSRLWWPLKSEPYSR